jgi:hypothetical protein
MVIFVVLVQLDAFNVQILIPARCVNQVTLYLLLLPVLLTVLPIVLLASIHKALCHPVIPIAINTRALLASLLV